MNPEEKARRNIDKMLEAAGWHIQNYAERDTGAALGVAVREYPLANAQRADYLLFVSGLAVGFIEAKKEGITLSGAAQQAAAKVYQLFGDDLDDILKSLTKKLVS